MRDLPLDPDVLDCLDWHVDEGLQERIDAVRAAIDTLPRDLADAVNGVFFEMVSQRQLARRLGISRRELRNRMTRATALIAEALA